MHEEVIMKYIFKIARKTLKGEIGERI
jgi:hypothetical protein